MLNAARLKVLKAREDHVGTVLDEAKKRLKDITQDQATYKGLMQSLITQGLLQVNIYIFS
jgi:V-type H+-transporting ATPase subunit E